LRRRLAEILAGKRQLHPDLTVLTGLGLGSEQIGAEAAAASGVPYVAVLAFPGSTRCGRRPPGDTSPNCSTGGRDGGPGRPETGDQAGRRGALARRDAWLARHAAEAVVVWDGADGAVGRTVRSLRDHLGEEDVWVLEPPA